MRASAPSAARKSAFDKIAEGLREALEIARGSKEAAIHPMPCDHPITLLCDRCATYHLDQLPTRRPR
jgi:hypothetical protein